MPQLKTPELDAFTSQLVALRFDTTSAVVDAVPVTERLVVVAFVAVSVVAVSAVTFAEAAVRRVSMIVLVERARVEKRLVVVAFVPVAFTNVKFLSVVDASTDRFPEMLRFVVVAPPCPMEKTVVELLVTASKREPVPHEVSFEYGVVVPMPKFPTAVRRILSESPVFADFV